MPPETSPAPAQLLERLLVDADFRAQFRKDPVAACRAFGLDDLAEQMSGQGRSMQTLEIRESKSSLAGVLMAAAAEAVGVIELVRYASGDGGGLGGEAASAVRQALSSPRLQAISMSQLQAVEGTPLGGAVADAPASPPPAGAPAPPDAPTGQQADAAALREDRLAAANCPDCGSPVVDMGSDVTICSNCGLRQDGVKLEDLSAEDQAALREDLGAVGACTSCGQAVAMGPDGACLYCGALGAGAAHLVLDEALPTAGRSLEDPVGFSVSRDDAGAPQRQGLFADQPVSAGGLADAGPTDEPIQVGGVQPSDRSGPPVGGGLGGAALPRDEPIGAPSDIGRAGAGATVRVAAVRPADGTRGDPPQSLGADGRQGDDGADRVQSAADSATPAPQPGGQVPIIETSQLTNRFVGGNFSGSSEFELQDAEGAPDPSTGARYHAGLDVFANAGAPVRSPIAGTVVEVRASRGNSGQVFGGTVKIQGADGKVWVFRHVDPAAIQVGQQVQAGQQVAGVTAWTDGSPHVHVERWLTFEGGYSKPNMVDPIIELRAAYENPGAPAPGVAGDPTSLPGGAQPPAADPQVLYQQAVQDLLANSNIVLPDAARADIQAGVLDPRLVIMLNKLAERHTISLSVIKTGHSQFVAGTTTESNHFAGRGIDIASVDGQIVRPDSPAARVLAEELGSMDPPLVPDEIGSPFSIGSGPPYFTDGAHLDHIHVGFDDPLPPGTPLPYPNAGQPDAAAGVPLPNKGRQSGLFAAVAAADTKQQEMAGAAAARRGMTVKFMPAITADPTRAPGAPQPVATPQSVTPDLPPGQIIPADQFDPADITPHPGPTASHAQVAQWMAENAQRVGIPPELPVMAAITESGLRYGLTPDVSDADSGGYFQMRVSYWNIPPWTNYMNEPEKQLHWFLSQALALKEKRIADGFTTFGQARDAESMGEWIADVERPAAQYRDRYATHLEDAQQLISGQRQSL